MQGYWIAAFMLVVLIAPMLVTAATVKWVLWREKQGRRKSPLTDRLRNGPGEQLRNRVDELKDQLDEQLLRLVIIGPFVVMIVLLPLMPWKSLVLPVISWVVIAVGAVFSAWCMYRIVRIRREIRRNRAGMRGEMSVAQELDKLMAQGCAVLHDIPAEVSGRKFNLDHVVVASSAVYVVETKWRSKHGAGKASAEASFDGKVITLGSGRKETKGLDQASAGANWLSKYLAGETGQHTPVIPVVALPGWYVKPRPTEQSSLVKVLNPKMMYELLGTTSPAIHPAQRNRIVNALTKCYPELEE